MASFNKFDQAPRQAPSGHNTDSTTDPTAVAARYDRRIHRMVVCFNTGLEVAFKPHDTPGLETATLDDLSVIEIHPSGWGLHFPTLDVDLYLPVLLEGVLGSRATQPLEIACARAERARMRATRATHAFQRVKRKLLKYQQSQDAVESR